MKESEKCYLCPRSKVLPMCGLYKLHPQILDPGFLGEPPEDKTRPGMTTGGVWRPEDAGGVILDSPPRRTAAVIDCGSRMTTGWGWGDAGVYSGFPSLTLENDKGRDAP